MTDIAIRVENLSKRYPSNNLRTRRIGRKEETHDTMVGAMTGFVRRPIHDVRRLRRLRRHGHDAEDIIWALNDPSVEAVGMSTLCGSLEGRSFRAPGRERTLRPDSDSSTETVE